MKKRVPVGPVCAVFVALAACAANGAVTTLYDISTSGRLTADTACWTNSLGEVKKWSAGAIAVMRPGSSNRGVDFKFYTQQVIIEPKSSGGTYWWDDNEGFFIGAGGLEFVRPCFWSHINRWLVDLVKLTANQTWRNDSTAGTARLALGSQFSYGGNMYNKARISAETGVTAWNLTGDLEVWLYSPNNRLQDVTVTVSDKAKICLVKSDNPRLNAKKLVLDGSTMPFDVYLGQDTNGFESRTIGTIDGEHVSDDVELRNGAKLSVGNATFAIPELKVVGAGNSITGTSLTLEQESSAVTFTEVGSELDFNVKLVNDADTSFEVSGPGTVGFVANKDGGYRGELNLSATSKAKIMGSDAFVADIRGGAGLEIAAQGTVVLCGSISEFTGEEIVVSSGTLLVGTMASLPTGTSVRTTGEGAVMFGTSEGYDPDRVKGTKKVTFASADDIYVTEYPLPAGPLSVGAGQRLHVYGNGLTEDTSLTLAGGMVLFHASATIAAPVAVSAFTVVTTAVASVTGTFAGRYDSQVASASYGTKIYGNGSVRFAGGGSFPSESDSVAVYGGEIHFTGSEYAFGSRGILVLNSTGSNDDDPNNNWCKRILVADGGVLRFATRDSHAIYGYSRTNGGSYFDEVVMEVGEGGTVVLEGLSSIQLGGNQSKARILVNGGTWKMGTGRVQFGGSGPGMGTGVVELNSGVFETGGSFGRTYNASAAYQDQGRFIFNGGTLRLTKGDGDRLLFRTWGTPPSPAEKHQNKLRAWMRVDGENCTVAVAAGLTVTNVPPDYERSELFGHGRLTVSGGGTFVLNAVGQGVDLALAGDGTKAVVAEAARVYDDAKCRAKQNVNPFQDKYTTADVLADEQALALETFALGGLGDSLLFEATLPVSVSNVTVEAGGEWNSSLSILGPNLMLKNIVFAEDAVIGASRGADGTMKTATFAGTLTLPSALRYLGRKLALAGDNLTFTAAAVVGSAPMLTPIAGNRAADCWFDASVNGFRFQPSGTLLLVR